MAWITIFAIKLALILPAEYFYVRKHASQPSCSPWSGVSIPYIIRLRPYDIAASCTGMFLEVIVPLLLVTTFHLRVLHSIRNRTRRNHKTVEMLINRSLQLHILANVEITDNHQHHKVSKYNSQQSNKHKFETTFDHHRKLSKCPRLQHGRYNLETIEEIQEINSADLNSDNIDDMIFESYSERPKLSSCYSSAHPVLDTQKTDNLMKCWNEPCNSLMINNKRKTSPQLKSEMFVAQQHQNLMLDITTTCHHQSRREIFPKENRNESVRKSLKLDHKCSNNLHHRLSNGNDDDAEEIHIISTIAKYEQMLKSDTQSTGKLQPSRDFKATVTITSLILVFTLFRLPLAVTIIKVAVCTRCVSVELFESLLWLFWAKSLLNPFLYAFISKRFRLTTVGKLRKFKNCLRMLLPQRQSNRVAPTIKY